MIQKILLCFLCLWGACEAKHTYEVPKGSQVRLAAYYEFHHGGSIRIDEVGNDDAIYFYNVQMRGFKPNVCVKMRVEEGEEKNSFSLKADRHGNVDAAYHPKNRHRTRKELEFTFYWERDNHTFTISVFPKGWDYLDPGEKPAAKKLYLMNYYRPIFNGYAVCGS